MKRRLFPIVGMLLGLSGCFKLNLSFVGVENSPAGERLEFAIFDPNLLGRWFVESNSDDPTVVREFLQLERASPESMSYQVTEWQVRRIDGRETTSRSGGTLEFHLMKVAGTFFSVVPFESESGGVYWILRADRLDDEYHYSMMNSDFFDGRDAIDGIEIKREKGDVALRADAETLRKFLARHAIDPALWSKSEKCCSRTAPPPKTIPEKKAVTRQAKAKMSR